MHYANHFQKNPMKAIHKLRHMQVEQLGFGQRLVFYINELYLLWDIDETRAREKKDSSDIDVKVECDTFIKANLLETAFVKAIESLTHSVIEFWNCLAKQEIRVKRALNASTEISSHI